MYVHSIHSETGNCAFPLKRERFYEMFTQSLFYVTCLPRYLSRYLVQFHFLAKIISIKEEKVTLFFQRFFSSDVNLNTVR